MVGRKKVVEEGVVYLLADRSPFFSFFFFLIICICLSYKDSHAPRPLFSSRLKYLPHSAYINLRVWALFLHDTSILAFHLGFIFK